MGLNLGLECSHECSSLIDFLRSHPYMSLERRSGTRMASHCNLTGWKDLKYKITDMAGNSHQRVPWLSDCAADVSCDGRSITADTMGGGIAASPSSSLFPLFPPASQTALFHWPVKPIIRLESKAIHHYTTPDPMPALDPVSTRAQTELFVSFHHS